MRIAEPSFAHLLRLTDDTGILEHSRGLVPRREHGYTTDDAARALIAVSRQVKPDSVLLRAGAIYLAFLEHARRSDGRYHNRLSFDRRWIDEVGSDDAHGRAVWALGVVAGMGPEGWMRTAAVGALRASRTPRSLSPRAHAFTVLGAVEALTAEPGNDHARGLLEQSVARLPRPRLGPWPWPEERLAYDNARLPEALIAAGSALEDSMLLADGVRLLEWLVEVETRQGTFSFTPVGGWRVGEPRPGFDQQPVEAAAMADACARAWEISGDGKWMTRLHAAAEWFLGRNDAGKALYDPATGASGDGISESGVNVNAGAEATVSAILALQQALRLRSAEGGDQRRLVHGRRAHRSVSGAISQVDRAIREAVGTLDEDDVGNVSLDLPRELGL